MQAFVAPTALPLRGKAAAAAFSARPSDVFASRRATPRMVVLGKPPTPSNVPAPGPDGDSSSSKPSTPALVSTLPQWKALQKHKESIIDQTHLRELLDDDERVLQLAAEYDGVFMDYSRQRISLETKKLLLELAEAVNLKQRIKDMVSGKRINTTENRAVLHTALRAKKSEVVMLDGVNVVEQVHTVLDRIRTFTETVRSGKHVGASGKHIKNFVAVGIGGSYLGPDFLYEALKTDPAASSAGQQAGYSLHFLANVDPVDVKRALDGFDPEETMVIVVSKTFTTRETIVNAKTVRTWLWDAMGTDPKVVRQHMVACSTNLAKTKDFGISPENVFPFWDWVGGRYSVCSSVGALPLSLMYGFNTFDKFLNGARSIDKHLVNAPLDRNIPVLMGLMGVWNMSFMGYKSRAMHPYTEALNKLPAHIQQVDMESNGKHVSRHGVDLDFEVGEVDFGEPGTLGQHSFFQLLHMGQVVPCTFIGFIESQNPTCQDGEPVSNHDELMSNFFAQPDALARGKTSEECRAEGRSEDLIPHITFTGNRPSLSLLLPVLNAYTCGQLLSLFEHRTAVQGFVWDINSFDQWGVELGKVLATKVRKQLNQARYHGKPVADFNASTKRMVERYLFGSVGCAFDEIIDYE
ncbi:Glucose-6-phosphate isomerase, cytosolic 1A [Gracilariopsis chorda]|uniref:Glucose-6-phosphate isomerase n=1 Tax=Gracilariopsis chorda TaxID=448386 RepID=A0A2V3IKD9_9FLOR|nr:Glucose-6-phosphate isomerase, cytosolic 1A [Gracilariopsis chorda]|eukprot:PXF42555.1 Glucose-6-phosphate isomerase, cytosolic 1A [Gracilariopsis chorda]